MRGDFLYGKRRGALDWLYTNTYLYFVFLLLFYSSWDWGKWDLFYRYGRDITRLSAMKQRKIGTYLLSYLNSMSTIIKETKSA